MRSAFRISQKFSLFFFPSIFLILQILLKADYKWFFLSVHDPAYAFLFNGLNIANGSLDLGLSGFPGIMLQCLTGVNLWLFKFFSGTSNLTMKVISEPEFFLNIISIEIIILNTTALTLTGLLTYRNTGNLPLSLALQLTPFISVKALSMDSVVMLEPFILFTELLLLIVIAKYVFETDKQLKNRTIIILALLMSLGFTTKTVFLPVVFLPWFAIEGFRKKILYVTFIIVFTAIMLIPVYPTFHYFLSWYKLILTHTGPYGSGESSLFNTGVYFHNILLVFKSNVLFTLAIIFVALAMVTINFSRWGKKISAQKKAILNGLSATFLLNIIMVARHFSFHYLFVSYNLSVFSFILVFSLIPESQTGIFHRKYVQSLALSIAGLLLIVNFIVKVDFSDRLINPRLKGCEFVKKEIQDQQRIIVLENPGPFIETALYHGYAYAGGMKPEYAPLLKQLYPSTWFFNPGEERLHDWVHDGNLEYLLAQNRLTYIYCGLKNDTLPETLAQKFSHLKDSGFIQYVKLRYNDTKSNDRIFEVQSDTQKIRKIILKPVTIYENNRFIRLNPQNPFSSLTKIKAEAGFYEITAIMDCVDDPGLIVAADSTGRYYKSNSISLTTHGNRNMITLVADIPDYLEGNVVSFYFWYPGKENCTFHDAKITFTKVNF